MEIIAEIGQNHNGDMKLAKKLIESAKESGAQVAKFQVYDAKALFPKEGNPWFDYNCQTELSQTQCKELFEYCEKVGIEFMASAFDPERVQWLEDLGVKRHKVASRSIRDEDLLSAYSKTNKTILTSLGMWDEDDFPDLPDNFEFLYCISKYPTPLEDFHLERVDFNIYSGFSDHSIGISAPLVACARGAKILEKHFTFDQKLYGPDHEGSMTPDELKQIASYTQDFKRILGESE